MVIVKQANLESLIEVALPQVPILGILGFEGIALDLIGTKNALHLADGIIDSVVFFKLLGIITCTKQKHIKPAKLTTAPISAENSRGKLLHHSRLHSIERACKVCFRMQEGGNCMQQLTFSCVETFDEGSNL